MIANIIGTACFCIALGIVLFVIVASWHGYCSPPKPRTDISSGPVVLCMDCNVTVRRPLLWDGTLSHGLCPKCNETRKAALAQWAAEKKGAA